MPGPGGSWDNWSNPVHQIEYHSSTHLAQGEVVEEARGTVCLPEGEGRGVAGHIEASTTVLGCNLSLEGPPVVWVRIQSLEERTKQHY